MPKKPPPDLPAGESPLCSTTTRCVLMQEACDRFSEHRREGLHEGSFFNVKTGKSNGSHPVYEFPARGRGKDRKSPFYAVVEVCPFCAGPLTEAGKSC